MSKDLFQRNAELANELRTEQFKIREYLQRGKYRMKQKFFNKGKKHYDFDLNSQEYFHEELHDLSFEASEVQEQCIGRLMQFLQQPCQFGHTAPYLLPALPPHRPQAEARAILHRFFSNRAHDLEYEKYLLMERLHNINAEEEIGFLKSRVTLIDKEILMALARADRLACEDYFEETYTAGSKPVPINENGQSIYKYLDEEDCWLSNIQREDILVYARHLLFRRDLLQKHYLPLHCEHSHIVQTHGLDLLLEAEEELAREKARAKEEALRQSRRLIGLLEEELELISPGNLAEKENIGSFIFYNFGCEEGQLPLELPLYPAIHSELLDSYNRVLPVFFKGLELREHRELLALLPKLSNFCAILFKYQNREILEGKEEVKLGLEDDIDIRKELHTMLEEIWTNKYVKVHFGRFDIRYRLKVTDWPLDTLA
jgi:hypothetical protein